MGTPEVPFDEDIADDILGCLAAGMPLTKWHKSRFGIVSLMTVYRWLRINPDFAEAYARAREDQADTYAEQVVGIADDLYDTGKTVFDARVAEARINSRKWAAENLKPRTYGKRVDVTSLNDHTLSKTPDEARAIRAAAILKIVQDRTALTSEDAEIVRASPLFD
jgi:hypothetical protein